MIFRQLFETSSATYTYLLGCRQTGHAVLIDPVLETVERDVELINSLGLRLAYALETHVHADHLTGARKLRALTGCKVTGAAADQLDCRDVNLEDDEILHVGSIDIHAIATPGHTDTHLAFLVDSDSHKMAFTGDSLMIDGCGRTDFQAGDAATLYRSIHQRLFILPGETLVYPGHDYTGRKVSTIAQERQRNPRLGGGKSEAEFVTIMANLNLPYPAKIEFAVKGNMLCGECPPEVPEELRGPCEIDLQG